MDNIVRLAVAGGNRGGAFNDTLKLLQDKVKLTCICDVNADKVREWQDNFPGIKGFTDYDEMLRQGDFDAVFIATPIKLHFSQTIKALEAGKHVLCEVYAADTLQQLSLLVETVERTGKVYMMAENYVYSRENMMIYNMTQQGLFGPITFAEGAYIHDCRPIRFNADGTLTWRGEQIKNERGNTYPTHSLGPVAKWMGITETDTMLRSSTFCSQNASIRNYIRKKFGDGHPALADGFWAYGDVTITTIECASGALIVLRFDGDSYRPHNMTWYQLQGVNGCYLSPRGWGDDPLIWLDGKSSLNDDLTAKDWNKLWDFTDELEHPLWKASLKDAEKFGHGGGDYFILDEFVSSILEERRPFIDVYEAAAWSSIVPVSLESVQRGGIPIDIPQFPRKEICYRRG